MEDEDSEPNRYESEEEEDECRVCRGPAEEGYVLVMYCFGVIVFSLTNKHKLKC